MRKIPVAAPVLAGREKEYVLDCLDSTWISSNGKYLDQFQEKFAAFCHTRHALACCNGTVALHLALLAYDLEPGDEVIVPSLTFVATANAVSYCGAKPIFVDSEPVTGNLDPAKIEAAITPQTTAIMPVHCYGHPCDVEAIQKIADNYNLKVIYDAAHAFGVQTENGSVLQYGDLAVLSFHATKVFNTFEGGAIICPDAKTKQRIDHLKNFGFVDETTVVAPGINGKMSEINAAFGLLQLKHIDVALARRKEIDARYRTLLRDVPGVRCVNDAGEKTANYSYFPILVENDYPLSRDALYQKFRDHEIIVRRYFYPLISEFPMYRGTPSAHRDNLPVASEAALKVLCIPIHPGMSDEDVNRVVDIIASA